ncbi:hypothetical protein [Amnibacterium endophyticum]|uniref:DUF4307 domain-containing protein n=1 Tax=Amnibacterium endophyticum TaxID=2109337 RepID=A0ABW4LIL0_9MICO
MVSLQDGMNGTEEAVVVSRTGRLVAVLLALIAVSALVVLGYSTARLSKGDQLGVASVSVPVLEGRGDSGGITGRLGASRSGDRACFWIDDSRQGGQRLYLLFALKYSASSALALLDQQGRTIAEAGETVTAVNAAPRPGAAPRFCPHGAGMTVYDVTRTNS